jgi:hypothetical protein
MGVGYIVPERITNYLRQGLPSTIYLLCFLKPRSGYELANAIYKRPTTAKIYNWAKVMVAKGYLAKNGHGYHAEITPLVAELAKILKDKGETLDFHEKKLLGVVLSSEPFRRAIQDAYESVDNKKLSDIVIFTTELLPLLTSLAFNLKRLQGRADISVIDALKIFSGRPDAKGSLKKNFINAEQFLLVMNAYLERVGMQSAGKVIVKGSEGELPPVVQFSLFVDLPNQLLLKISKLSPNAALVTYIFSIVFSFVVMNLKEEAEQMGKREME